MSRIKALMIRPVAICRSLGELTEREQRHLTSEMLQARGLMPLL